SICFMIFVFSHKGITSSLLYRHYNRVSIKGLFDNSFASSAITANWNCVPFNKLQQQGIEVKYDNERAKVHHKLMLIDDEQIITGSFNYSRNAQEHNNENLLVINSAPLAELYQHRFKQIYKRFPRRSLEQRYRLLYNKRKGTNDYYPGFWEKYRKKHYANIGRKLALFKKKGYFKGVIRDILCGNIIRIESLLLEDYLTVRLSGCIAPVKYGQEPQATYALQYLAYHGANKPATVFITSVDGWLQYTGMVYPEHKTEALSLNEKILEAGWCYSGNIKQQSRYFRCLRQAALYGQSMGRGVWSPKFKLLQPPWLFRQKLEQEQLALTEKQYQNSLPQYRPGCILADCKNGKYYTSRQNAYWHKLEKKGKEELLFFISECKAEQAGFIKSRAY
ncbi:MAG TPA: phospholipase D-like domain-containing protein, partial [Spirochaetota bacterium]|nr:phospholipase D-like domain-containing protein [Spirochaetota bacterium]